jgi:competence protein ComEC
MSTHVKTLIFVVGVCLGIVVGEVSGMASEVGVVVILLVITQAILVASSKKQVVREKSGREASALLIPLIIILFSLGLFIGIIRVQLVAEKTNFVCESICSFDAKIISSPETKNDYQIFNVHPLASNPTPLVSPDEAHPTSLELRGAHPTLLTSSDGASILDIQVRTALYPKHQIGETLKISGKVNIPDVIYPHDDKNNKSFDYASYLQTKNIGSEMTYPKIEVIDGEAHTTTSVLGRWKENLIERINLYVSDPASSLASGMLFGASSVSKELLQTFRIAGLSHIIVLSGFNIVIVIASILFVLAFVPLFLRIILASISVIIFVMMVGAEPSVVRATLMAFISLLAMLVGRAYMARQALIISLFAIIMYEPYSLMHDVSIHLSFLATMGLVYMSEPIEMFLKKYFSLTTTSSLREIFVTTVSAYFTTLPYIMYTFGTISLYALLSNIVVLPFIPVAMLLSFFVVVSSYLSHGLSLVFGFVDTQLINFLIGVARAIESLPFSYFQMTVSFTFMCLMYVFIFILIKYILYKIKNETTSRDKSGNLTDIIKY